MELNSQTEATTDSTQKKASNGVVEREDGGGDRKEDGVVQKAEEGDSNKLKKNDAVATSKTIEREGNCYCGKERNLNIIELLCASCMRWFHESCIGYQLGKLVPFMMNYVFICKNCSPTGLESFKKNQATFNQMCITAIGNLMQASQKEGHLRTMFSKDQEIIPFIGTHWEGMTTMPRRTTQSWHSTIQKTLQKDVSVTFTCQETPPDVPQSPKSPTFVPGYPAFGLMNTDLVTVRPNYEAMIRAGHLKVSDMGIQNVLGTGGMKRGSAKRKFPETGASLNKKTRSDMTVPKLPAHGYPLEHPYNKDGYRYILAEPDPHAPFRQEFDENNDWAGKPIPGWLYRMLNPSNVLLSLHDRATQLKVSEDRLSLTGEKGYCMIRATHSVNRGSWYWEAQIDDQPEGSATRLGWSQAYGNLQAPLGYNQFSYSWRSRKGTKFHESHGKHYSSKYKEGDVLGFLIILPEADDISYLPPTYKDKPLVKFKSHLYYEEKDDVQEALKKLKILKGSRIIFFKNGICQGVAFEDIYGGSYYPAVSLYKGVTMSVNFGPHFKYPPKEYKCRGMNEKAELAVIEQTLADLIYLTENEGKLRLDKFFP